MQHLKSFYSNLYKSDFPTDTITMSHFFDKLPIPTIGPAITNDLDSQLKKRAALPVAPIALCPF